MSFLTVSARADELSVRMLSGEKWWGLGSGFGRRMPFDEQTDFKCDLRVSNYANQTASLLISSRGRVKTTNNARDWPSVVELPEGYPYRHLLLTMDRVNIPGVPTPNWTYGGLHLYVADATVTLDGTF